MNKILKSIIGFMILALMLVSCEEDGLESLSGTYTHPDVCDYTVLDSQIREKNGTLFEFSIHLTDDASNTLNLKLYSSSYALPTSDYTPSESAADKTYLIGSEGSTCNGQQITGNTISITANGSDYVMEGIIHLADETVVRMTGSFSIVYEYIPLYTYGIATETPVYGGYTGDVEIVGSAKQTITVYSDGVSYAQFQVVTDAAATSVAGTWPVTDPLSAIDQAAAGYYLDLSWLGWGTDVVTGGCYYKESGETYYVRGGDIVIAEDGSVLSISGSDLVLQDVAATETQFPASYTYPTLEETGSFEFTEVKEALVNSISRVAYSDGTAYSTYLIFTTSGVTSTYYPDYYAWGHVGNGSVVSLQFYGLSAATLTPGTYDIVDVDSDAEGDVVAGYVDPTYFYNKASVLTSVVDDVTSEELINSGTVEVIADGDNYILVMSLSTNSGTYQTTYNGPVSVTVY